MTDDQRRCSRCGETKPLSEFYPATKAGRQRWCKNCIRQYQRDYWHACKDRLPKFCAFCGEPLQKGKVKFCSRSCERKDYYRRTVLGNRCKHMGFAPATPGEFWSPSPPPPRDAAKTLQKTYPQAG